MSAPYAPRAVQSVDVPLLEQSGRALTGARAVCQTGESHVRICQAL